MNKGIPRLVPRLPWPGNPSCALLDCSLSPQRLYDEVEYTGGCASCVARTMQVDDFLRECPKIEKKTIVELLDRREVSRVTSILEMIRHTEPIRGFRRCALAFSASDISTRRTSGERADG